MNFRPLGKEVKILITQFLDSLSQIIIERRNQDLAVEDQIEVNIVYSPKQRILFDLLNKNQHIQIPVISCYITAFQRDPQRVFNKIQGSYYNMFPATSGSESLLQPLPINITMGVSIICRYQNDLDQILGQLAYYDPYIVVSWMDPLLNFTEVRSTVYWDESVRIQYPIETAANQPTRIIADTSFTIKGWIYKKPQPGVGKIYHIKTTFTSVSELDIAYSQLTALQTPDSSEQFTISAIPQIKRVFPSYTLTGVETDFLMYGDMFSFQNHCVSGIYAIPLDENIYPSLSWFNPLSSQPSLSGMYPGFSGVPILDYTIEDNNIITFTLPSTENYGFVDILTWNEAGYSRLTNAIKSNTILWEGSGAEYWNSYQDTSVLGIESKPTALSGGIGVYEVGNTFTILPKFTPQIMKTGQIISYQTGDDGYYQKGITIPTTRFIIQNTVCVLDTLTNLVWTKDVNIAESTMTWNEAIDYCESLNYGGYTDWRLPNLLEIKSLLDISQNSPALPLNHLFVGEELTMPVTYFTSTTMPGDPWGPKTHDSIVYPQNIINEHILCILLQTGKTADVYKTGNYYIWPVRGG